MELTVAFSAWIARFLWKPMEMIIATISSGGWLSSPTAPNTAAPLEATSPNAGMTNGSAKSGTNKHSSVCSFASLNWKVNNTNKQTGPQKQSWNQCKFISLTQLGLRCVESLKNKKMNMHVTKYLGGQNTEPAGTTWHITEVKQLQESSKDWYGSNDDTILVDNPADTPIDVKWIDSMADICQSSSSGTHFSFTQATQKPTVKCELNQICFLTKECSAILSAESWVQTLHGWNTGSGEHLAALFVSK